MEYKNKKVKKLTLPDIDIRHLLNWIWKKGNEANFTCYRDLRNWIQKKGNNANLPGIATCGI